MLDNQRDKTIDKSMKIDYNIYIRLRKIIMKNTKNWVLLNEITNEVPAGTIISRRHVTRMVNVASLVEYYNVFVRGKFHKLSLADLSEEA